MLKGDDKVAHALNEHLGIRFHVTVGSCNSLGLSRSGEGAGGQGVKGEIGFDGLSLGIDLNAVVSIFMIPYIAIGASAQGYFARHENGGGMGDMERDRLDADGGRLALAHRHEAKFTFVG